LKGSDTEGAFKGSIETEDVNADNVEVAEVTSKPDDDETPMPNNDGDANSKGDNDEKAATDGEPTVDEGEDSRKTCLPLDLLGEKPSLPSILSKRLLLQTNVSKPTRHITVQSC
jgi:hypothetical protein